MEMECEVRVCVRCPRLTSHPPTLGHAASSSCLPSSCSLAPSCDCMLMHVCVSCDHARFSVCWCTAVPGYLALAAVVWLHRHYIQSCHFVRLSMAPCVLCVLLCQVESWFDFALNEVEVRVISWPYPVLVYSTFIAAVHTHARVTSSAQLDAAVNLWCAWCWRACFV